MPAVRKHPETRRRQRKPHLAAVLSAAKEAGIAVRRVRVGADGSIEIETDEASTSDSPQKVLDQL